MNNEQLTEKVIELESRINKLEQINNPASSLESSSRRQKTSIVEFLREKKPKTTVEKALVFAVFNEMVNGVESFCTEDILTLWRQAKEAMPSNVNDLINKNVKKGLMAEETAKKDGKKSWYVTRSGMDALKFDKSE